HALRGAVAERNIDGGDGGSPRGYAQLNFLVARRGALFERPLAIVEGPSAGGSRQHRPGNRNSDAVIARRQVIFAHPVALASLHQLTGSIDAEIANHVLGPADTVAVALESPFGGEDAVTAARRHHAQEVGLLAEQAEAVLHLPGDVKIAGVGKLR